MGRDVLSQLLYSTRSEFVLGITAALVTVGIATMVGAVAAYYGGLPDALLMRLADRVIALPAISLLIVLSALFNLNLFYLALIIGLLGGFGGTAIILKSQALSIRVKPFIEAARVAGGGQFHIIFVHIVPHLLPLSLLYTMFTVTSAIFAEAVLSFLGLLDLRMSWRIMIHTANTGGYLLGGTRHWWLIVPPGASITLLCSALYLGGPGTGRGGKSKAETTQRLMGGVGLELNMNSGPVLEVSGLSLTYLVRQGEVRAVQDVSFQLLRGQSLGLVGESGCGKSSVANCLLRLLPDNARVSGGRVLLDGRDLLSMTEEEIRAYRWRRISMVFQTAMNVLDPVYRVGEQIVEAIEAHGVETSDAAARERVSNLFRKVGLDPLLMHRYPHEFSGGMRQRAVIAMALSCDPDVIIADEPTTALDVIVQDGILRELKSIQRENNMAAIYISHDIAVVAEVTDTVAVMYAGRLVEIGKTVEVLNAPWYPYTASLTSSFPSITTTGYLGRKLVHRILRLLIDWRKSPTKKGP